MSLNITLKNVLVFLFVFLSVFFSVCEMYACVTKHSAWDVVWGVTNYRDQCPSPTGINWVSDGVSINSRGIYVYQRCSLLM